MPSKFLLNKIGHTYMPCTHAVLIGFELYKESVLLGGHRKGITQHGVFLGKISGKGFSGAYVQQNRYPFRRLNLSILEDFAIVIVQCCPQCNEVS